ncbi:alpha-amylase [Salinicoccus sediminis]|uniref:Alpha-amylase n=1 Tax=Salinicoccus sediminis TaxID=1432562 RepID=A0A0M2SKG7_9STAP|nr:alpha-amylase [Salinicoccus sediminis]KKK33337.1 alpha-amylase [Salinicoccus sediminis]
MNLTLMQYFEWHSPDNGEHWNHLSKEARKIKEMGFDAVWLPPPTKADHPSNPGYAAYDVYDLGEFDQKGSIRTKYGTREQLQNAIKACREAGLLVYLDLVMNHKAGGDKKETFKVVEVREDDREEEISEPFDIEGYTYFDFPGRHGKYSDFKWNFNLFTGVDYDARKEQNGIFRIMGEDKDWSDNVDAEHGNYDYLMYADIDYAHPEVQEEMVRWGKWLTDELDADGYRLDAVKHIDSNFIKRFIDEVAEHAGREIYFFGEYWNPSLEANEDFLDEVSFDIDVFDVRLHYNFYTAGLEKAAYDLTQIFDRSMVAEYPWNAVTFVDNHDTQPGESLESFVADWFKQPAYSLILLRQDGYPCVFYGDYHGINGEHKIDGRKDEIDVLLDARKNLAYGNQEDYFDHPDTIGWIRFGTEDLPGSGCAVVIANGLEEGYKKMHVGETRTGEKWVDYTENRSDEITIDEEGNGVFYADSQSVSVYGKKTD